MTDSTAYVPPHQKEKLHIEVIAHTINFPDGSYKEDEISVEYLFSRLTQTKVFPSTSLPAPGEFYTRYESLLKEGHDILVIPLASALSGTYNSACLARMMIREQYPSANITVLDLQRCGMAQGLVAMKAAEQAQAGMSLANLVSYAEDMGKRVDTYFIPATLEYLIRGGRLRGLPALMGTILNIRPIIKLENSQAVVVEKIRGFKTAFKSLLHIIEDVHNNQGLDTLAVYHTANQEKALELAGIIKERYGLEAIQVTIGPVVGLHLGPGSIGIAYCTKT